MRTLTLKVPTWSDAVALKAAASAKLAARKEKRAAAKAVRDAVEAAKAEQQRQLHDLAAEILKSRRS